MNIDLHDCNIIKQNFFSSICCFICLIVALRQSHYVIESLRHRLVIRSRICQFRNFSLNEVSNLIQFCSCSIFSLFNFSFFHLRSFVSFWNHFLISDNSFCNSALLLYFWFTSYSLHWLSVIEKVYQLI